MRSSARDARQDGRGRARPGQVASAKSRRELAPGVDGGAQRAPSRDLRAFGRRGPGRIRCPPLGACKRYTTTIVETPVRAPCCAGGPGRSVGLDLDVWWRRAAPALLRRMTSPRCGRGLSRAHRRPGRSGAAHPADGAASTGDRGERLPKHMVRNIVGTLSRSSRPPRPGSLAALLEGRDRDPAARPAARPGPRRGVLPARNVNPHPLRRMTKVVGVAIGVLGVALGPGLSRLVNAPAPCSCCC